MKEAIVKVQRNWQSDAIIIQTRRIGEIHRGLQLLLPDGRLVSAIAHGAHSRRGSLRGKTELFSRGHAWLYTDNARQSTKLSDFDPLDYHSGIRDALVRLYVASLWSEFLLATYAGGGQSDELYVLLSQALSVLQDASDTDAVKTNIWFLWRVLAVYGNRPDPDVDVHSGDPIPESSSVVFDLHEWGFAVADSSQVVLDPGPRRYLARLTDIDCVEAPNVEPGTRGIGQVKRVLYLMIRSLAERPLKTLDQGVL